MNNENETICPRCKATFLSELHSCPFCGETVKQSPKIEHFQYNKQNDNLIKEEVRIRKESLQRKRKRIISWTCVILSVFLAVWLIGREVYRIRNRNLDTDTVEVGYKNVSADIVSIEPRYEVYRKDDKSHLGSMYTSGYLCECQTIDGNTIWVYTPYVENRHMFSLPFSSDRSVKKQTYPSDDPLRLIGSITKLGSIADEIPASLDKEMNVLEVDKYPVAHNDRPERQEYLKISRNMETDDIEEGMSNVYVDIVSISPQISLVKEYSSVWGSVFSGIVCKCKTINGKTVWAYCKVGGWLNGYTEKDYPPRQFPSSHPLRLKGTIISADSLSWDLFSKIEFEKHLLQIDKYPDEYIKETTKDLSR